MRGCAGAGGSGQWTEKSNAFDAGKGEMGKVREKGLRRGKTAFCRGATHRKTSFE